MTTFIQKISAFFSNYYKLDLRALALMRIALALVVIADLIIRYGDVTVFYTNEGMWPLDMLKHSGWKEGYWSLHALSGNAFLQIGLLVLQFILALTLLFGFYSRTSAFLIYVLYISLHNRNIFILQAGDDLLRIVLLACSLLPIGARYAFDARKSKSISLSAGASMFYLLLIASVYVFTVLLKTGPDWRSDFTAVHYALQLRQLRMPLGEFLLQFPSLHAPFTVISLLLEIAIPLLILWPSSSGKTRLYAFLCLLILHLAIGATLYVGLFYLINICSAIALLPASVMDKFEKLLPASSSTDLQAAQSSALQNSIAIILIFLCSFVNLSTVKSFEYEPGPPLAQVINAARLDQNWAMFSPGVLRKDGWLVLFGRDELGRQMDLRTHEDYVKFTEPSSVSAMYKNDRWRKWAENMQDERFTFLRPLFCEYILKTYNTHAKKQKAKTLHVYFMQIDNSIDSTKTNPERKLYSFCHD